MKIRKFDRLLMNQGKIRIIWLILLLIALILAGEFIIVDPLGLLLEKTRLGMVSGDFASDWNSALGDSIKRMIRMILVVGFTIILLKKYSKSSLNEIGSGVNLKALIYFVTGIGLGFLIQVVSILLMSALGYYSITGFAWEYDEYYQAGPAWLHSICYSMETGVMEEFLFRGFLLYIFMVRYNVRVGIISSSTVFALLHFTGFDNVFPWWASIISSLLAGLVFAQAFLCVKNIWLPVGLHFAIHLASRILGSVGLEPGNAMVLVTEVDGPILLINTKAGGAGFFELLGYSVVSLILWFIAKRLKCKSNLKS